MCEQMRNFAACGRMLTNKKEHESNKPCCASCKQNMEIGYVCSMSTSKNESPRSVNVLFVLYDFEAT